jgi:hypothetical protein
MCKNTGLNLNSLQGLTKPNLSTPYLPQNLETQCCCHIRWVFKYVSQQNPGGWLPHGNSDSELGYWANQQINQLYTLQAAIPAGALSHCYL